MLFVLLMSLAAALLAPTVARVARGAAGSLLALIPLAGFVYFASQIPAVAGGATLHVTYPWVPSFGVMVSLYLDGLSLLFALLITGLGTLIVLYTSGYLRGHPQLGRFYLYLLLFMSAMIGLVLSDNLITLFVFWELTSFSSYLLIGFKHEAEKARKSALQALLVTGAGGLALLAGLLLLGYAAGGTFELREIFANGEAVRAHALYLPIFLLIILGAFTKSAQFPFHFWLPNAMAAPTPVSAYLHSATMVKAGIYLLARMDGLLGGTEVWVWTLSLAGALTMLIGAVSAVRHTDLKKILAYSTITALGTLTLLLGLSFEESIKAAMVFLVVHSLYKGALFLVAGSVDHATGTRDLRALGGLRPAMPWTAGAAILAGLSMAGLPPLFGFVGKELAYKAKLGFDGADVILPAIAVLANALTVTAALILVLRPFFGELKMTAKEPHRMGWRMALGPVVLAGFGLLFGLLPMVLAAPLVSPAVFAVLGGEMPIKLSLWYGFNLALLLSGVTLLLGVLGYWAWDRYRPALERGVEVLARIGPETGYERGLAGTVRLAEWQTQVVQGGSLTRHLTLIVTTLLGFLGVAFWLRGGWDYVEAAGASLAGVHFVDGTLVAVAVASTALVIWSRSRLTGVMALGVMGFCVALLFLRLGAPDVAMTQFLVETLIVLILLLVIARLPGFPAVQTPQPAMRWVHGLLALGAGTLVTGLVLAITHQPLDLTVPQYFAQESMPSGYGRNVVNVILVDFRALDTLGEIVVLAVAALGAYVLVRYGALPGLPELDFSGSLILRTTTRLLITLLFMTALFLLWRGHNEPGGGFIGGLIAAGALALYLIAFGERALRDLLRVHPRGLLGVGLGLALLSGLFALFGGEAFMAGQWVTLPLAGGGTLKLGTPLLFDVGVFLVVIGFTLTFLLALQRTAKAAEAQAVPTLEETTT